MAEGLTLFWNTVVKTALEKGTHNILVDHFEPMQRDQGLDESLQDFEAVLVYAPPEKLLGHLKKRCEESDFRSRSEVLSHWEKLYHEDFDEVRKSDILGGVSTLPTLNSEMTLDNQETLYLPINYNIIINDKKYSDSDTKDNIVERLKSAIGCENTIAQYYEVQGSRLKAQGSRLRIQLCKQ